MSGLRGVPLVPVGIAVAAGVGDGLLSARDYHGDVVPTTNDDGDAYYRVLLALAGGAGMRRGWPRGISLPLLAAGVALTARDLMNLAIIPHDPIAKYL